MTRELPCDLLILHSCKRYDRLLKANGISRNGATKSETKPKRRNTEAVAKAAEEKRRKIEGDHNDPTADDDEIKPVNPNPELDTESMIKQDPGSEYPSFFHTSPFLQPQNAYFSTYKPAATTLPKPGYLLHHSTALNAPLPQSHPMWQNARQSFSRTASSPPSTSQKLSNYYHSISSPEVAAVGIKKETTTEQTVLPSTPRPSTQNESQRQDAVAQSHQDDSAFRDFCNSDLFMPPLQHKTTPPSQPAGPHNQDVIPGADASPRTAASKEAIANSLQPTESTLGQPEYIVIDD